MNIKNNDKSILLDAQNKNIKFVMPITERGERERDKRVEFSYKVELKFLSV